MDYNYFLHTHTKDKWQKIGVQRRAGVVVPLFSVWSEQSIGIGEIPDIKQLVEWCKLTGISIIQLLPLNDVGGDFAPYSSVSTFALDPMYLSLRSLVGVDTTTYEKDLQRIKRKSRPSFGRVNYKVKQLKLDLLWLIYKSHETNSPVFNSYIQKNISWLRDYALYKVIREANPHDGWDKWEDKLKHRYPEALKEVEDLNVEKMRFHYWMQWQLHEQMGEIKKFAGENGIFIMGDLPFLVSRESADVWSHQNYFLTDLSSGAPPDMYFALGQKWGMPPYDWHNIANDKFAYLIEKLKYAENFYDMYRIDHFVGLFRLWVSPLNNVPEANAPVGAYMPPEEYHWEQHGRRIIDVMVHSTSMLPCAEDLGTVPGCSYHVLYEYGIPGIDFQRYFKEGARFKTPGEYRINSQAVVSTHDSSFWINWWQYEAGTIDEKLFDMMCEKDNIDPRHAKYAKSVLFNKKLSRYGRLYWNDDIASHQLMIEILQAKEKANDFAYMYMESYMEKRKFLEYLEYPEGDINEVSAALMQKCLDKANQAASVFSIQLIQEYLGLDEGILQKMCKWKYRINTPGLVSKENWSLILPVSLERLLKLEINHAIKELVTKNYR